MKLSGVLGIITTDAQLLHQLPPHLPTMGGFLFGGDRPTASFLTICLYRTKHLALSHQPRVPEDGGDDT